MEFGCAAKSILTSLVMVGPGLDWSLVVCSKEYSNVAPSPQAVGFPVGMIIPTSTIPNNRDGIGLTGGHCGELQNLIGGNMFDGEV